MLRATWKIGLKSSFYVRVGEWKVPHFLFLKFPTKLYFFLWFLEAMKWATSHFSNMSTKEEKAKEDVGENKTSPFQKAPKREAKNKY